ncbi:MAG: hypothetical protein SH819_15040 [Cytophagales bacterium]|nr:hypothetical protein [Cytophagales bacterium]
MPEITLFHEEREDITIDICARFDGEALVIDGYDIGKRVKEYWGDSDYEYFMKIPIAGVEVLYKHFEIPGPDKDQLLSLIQTRYHSNRCYSELEKLVSDLGIVHESFKWA